MPSSSTRPHLTFVLGGARSGKSRYAEALAERQTGPCVYLATAENPVGEAGDAEMAARIREHQARRGERWQTVETPLELAEELRAAVGADRCVLVDCLTLWLSNLMAAGRDIAAETEALTGTVPALSGPVIMVSNEVGLGIVPENDLARSFRDHAGRLNQAIAEVADSVVFVAAGLAIPLKSADPKISRQPEMTA